MEIPRIIPSIMFYVPPSVERLRPTITSDFVIDSIVTFKSNNLIKTKTALESLVCHEI